VRLFLGKNQHKKRAGKVSQRVDPEFKPQFHKKKKKGRKKKRLSYIPEIPGLSFDLRNLSPSWKVMVRIKIEIQIGNQNAIVGNRKHKSG
jgi:hypothetical protein